MTEPPDADADVGHDGGADSGPKPDDRITFRRVALFAGVIVVLLLIRSFVMEPARVRSDSMLPTLPPGAVLLIDKVSLRVREPHRGDIVIAIDPRSGQSIVKRVVAVGGDSVGIEDGVLVVNGTTIVEKYIDNDNMDGFYFGPDVVPADHVFLLGDNRDTSEDSRAFGPVAVDDIDGRVLGKIWPFG
jgi:signal peptidase I